MPQLISDVRSFLDGLSASLADSASIQRHEVSDGRLECEASGTAESIRYRVSVEDDRVWVSLVTKDRWMSESIEADLMHSGDKLEELIEDELADLGVVGTPVSFEHFRSEDLAFTFRTPIEVSEGGAVEIQAKTGTMLHAYMACFAQLGDVSDDSAAD